MSYLRKGGGGGGGLKRERSTENREKHREQREAQRTERVLCVRFMVALGGSCSVYIHMRGV